MRTTLDVDDDVLQAARELVALRGKTVGQVVSELERRGLAPAASHRERNRRPRAAAPARWQAASDDEARQQPERRRVIRPALLDVNVLIALFDPDHINTDVYLLGVAVKHGGRLVTFDRGIPLTAVRGATAGSLEVIAPV